MGKGSSANGRPQFFLAALEAQTRMDGFFGAKRLRDADRACDARRNFILLRVFARIPFFRLRIRFGTSADGGTPWSFREKRAPPSACRSLHGGAAARRRTNRIQNKRGSSAIAKTKTVASVRCKNSCREDFEEDGALRMDVSLVSRFAGIEPLTPRLRFRT